MPSTVILPATYNGRSVTTIKFNGFTESPIETLIIPEGYTTINSMAFYYCKKLKNVTFPKSMKRINQEAFSSCSSLSKATFLDKNNWKLGSVIGGYLTVKVTLSAADVADSSLMADYLKYTYETRTWVRTTGSGYNW